VRARGSCLVGFIVAALMVPSGAGGQPACIGDCSGDGAVSVAELIVGVRAVLDGVSPSPCIAWDPDGDGRVRIEDLVRGVAAALAGSCSEAATPTVAPTPVANALADLLLPPFTQACHSPPQVVFVSAGPEGVGMSCMVYAGHENNTDLQRYASTDEARAAFANATNGFQPAILRDLPAAYDVKPFPYTKDLGGEYRILVWRLDCWVATVTSFDDTSYRYAPDPTALSEALLDAGREELVAACASWSFATPTETSTPPPASPTPTPAPDGCRNDADCTASFDRCLEPGGFLGCGICYSDAEIDSDFQRCSADADCGSGVCQPLGPSTRTCSPCSGIAYVCMPGCASDAECEPGTTCDRGRCAPQPCSADPDCPPQHACIQESDQAPPVCLRKSCSSDLGCEGAFCVDGSCYDALGRCTPPPP
jgi:hypothetical protein